MLSREDSELLCRVGAGTPMGELMRRYWMPVAYTNEVLADGQPQRVRVLGEDLILWRDTAGTPSLVQDRCPHRGAGFYFGRNEENGLRCAYHGWKFDVSGECIDTPNEPVRSNFKTKVRITAYRGTDFGGIVWAYLGPDQANPPGVLQFEWGLVPQEQVQHVYKLIHECNWMQGLEGELDSTHVYFLHSRLNPDDSPKYGLYLKERGATFHILDTDIGVTYGAERPAPDGNAFWRMTNFLFPIYGMWSGSPEHGLVPLSIYLPVDDYHTLHFGLFWDPSKPITDPSGPPSEFPSEVGELGPGVGPMLPEQRGKFFSTSWPVASPDNDFMMDLEAKDTRNSTGIPTVRLQDSAVIWSMGAIMDRTREHMGTTDATVIRVRRRLIQAAKAMRDHGTVPPGVEHPELYKVRSVATILPGDADWLEALADWRFARTNERPNVETMENRAIPGREKA